jgi:hypothetical protein
VSKAAKTVRVYLRMTPEQHAELLTATKHLGVPLSTWMLMTSLKEVRLLPSGLVDAHEAPKSARGKREGVATSESAKTKASKKATDRKSSRKLVLVDAP